MGAAAVSALVLAGLLPASILVEMQCRSELGTASITLFDRGGVRVAQRVGAEVERVSVRELAPDELEAYLARIDGVDLREVPEASATGRGAEGEWLEQCDLILQPQGQQQRYYRWRRIDTIPLGLSNLVQIVEELAVGAAELRRTRLPDGYQPQEGDLLRRSDGVLFRVIAPTSDGRGVELQGDSQPLVIFILLDQLDEEMVELVESRALQR